MIAVVQRQSGPHLVDGAVSEWSVPPAEAERGNRAVMGDAAERQDGAKIRHRCDRRDKKRSAGLDLGRYWLVGGRHAADRIGDRRVDKLETVVAAGVVGAAGEAIVEERAV